MFSKNEEHISSSYFGIGQSNAGEYAAENADLMVQYRNGSAVHFRFEEPSSVPPEETSN